MICKGRSWACDVITIYLIYPIFSNFGTTRSLQYKPQVLCISYHCTLIVNYSIHFFSDNITDIPSTVDEVEETYDNDRGDFMTIFQFNKTRFKRLYPI